MIDTIMDMFILSPYFWGGGIIGILVSTLFREDDIDDRIISVIGILVVAGCGFMWGFTV